MMIPKSRLDRLRLEHNRLKRDYRRLERDWNSLVERINAKGGEAFLSGSGAFSKVELSKLLMLCHPDKHDGKKMAIEMTQKLLALREQG